MREEKAVGRGEAGPAAVTAEKSYSLISFPTEKAFASTFPNP